MPGDACCTYRRPDQLAECLHSLLLLKASSLDLVLILIDNDPSCSGQPVLESVASGFPGQTIYVPAQPTGAAFARNAALDAAEALEADWLAFIDDDQVAPSNWAEELVAAIQRHDADLIFAPTRYFCRHGAFAEIFNTFSTPIGAEGAPVAWGGTGNLIIRRRIFASDGWGLRFDTRLSLIGGEDLEFTRRASERGAVMKRTNYAVVREEIPPSRATLRYAASRSYYSVRLEQLLCALGPKLERRSGRLKYSALRLVRGTIRMPLALLSVVATLGVWRGGKRQLFRSVIDLSQGLGLLSTVLSPLHMERIERVTLRKSG